VGAGQRRPVGSFASPIGRLHFDQRRIANKNDYGLHHTRDDDRGSGAEEHDWSTNYRSLLCKDFVQRSIEETSFGLMHCGGLVQGVAVMALNAGEWLRYANVPRDETSLQLVRVVVR
jgi:hypothetical protein